MKNSFHKNFSQFTVVIRSAGERTTAVCNRIVCNEINENQVHIITKMPFEEALRESYRIGIKSGTKWLITIDADLLPREGFMNKIEAISSGVSDDIFSFKAMIYDRFFLNHRMAGFRVYRCSMLQEALTLVPVNGTQIRPEQHTVNQMVKKGYKTKVSEYVVALHDYEQFYRDLYRKAFFHASKHPQQVAENLSKWKSLSGSDQDFVVMIKGAVDGLLSSDSPTADIRFYKSYTEKAMSELGITEKEEIDFEKVKELIKQQMIENGTFNKDHSLQAAKKRIEKYGSIGGAAHHFGFLMEAAGKIIKKKVEG